MYAKNLYVKKKLILSLFIYCVKRHFKLIITMYTILDSIVAENCEQNETFWEI